jgi:hypothetical protein
VLPAWGCAEVPDRGLTQVAACVHRGVGTGMPEGQPSRHPRHPVRGSPCTHPDPEEFIVTDAASDNTAQLNALTISCTLKPSPEPSSS